MKFFRPDQRLDLVDFGEIRAFMYRGEKLLRATFEVVRKKELSAVPALSRHRAARLHEML